ncbi:MAG: hypothetical protein AB1304_07725 [Bacteroidota bacterium]
MNNPYKNYLEDCLEQLIDRSIEVRERSNETKDPFEQGRYFAYYEILVFLLNQAEVFEIKDELKEKIKTFFPSI